MSALEGKHFRKKEIKEQKERTNKKQTSEQRAPSKYLITKF
jgi:hypothetical protein